MTLIAAVDRAWGIGRGGRLLFRILADLRRFKALTMGHALLMGRKTFESLPGPLPGRACGVLSASRCSIPGVTVLRTKEEALAWAQGMPCEQGRETFLIGGASVYEALLDDCDTACITKIDALGGADAFMPNLDALPQWRLTEAGPWQEDGGLRFRYCVYARVP